MKPRGEGTGFKFYGLTAKNLANTVGWAVHTWYNQKDHFKAMQQRAMQKQYTWEQSAKTYVELYKAALQRAGKH